MPQRKRWNDLTPTQKTLLLVGASIELSLTMTALADLVTRPSTALRGPRLAWLAALVVQPFGPVAYLTLARQRP
jgi:Phospholipase_D-nuclease N-terminal